MPKTNQASRAIALIFFFLFTVGFCACAAKPQTPTEDIDLLPKYGLLPKNAAQRAADEQFIAKTDQEFNGNRKKAAADIAERGWYLLRQGDAAMAMRRFNQAWLLDPENGSALWGMAKLRAEASKFPEALALFDEAEPLVGDDVNFMADQAKAIGFAGLQQKEEKLIDNALIRFSYIYDRAPEHTRNLQNWAIVLYFIGNYREAWEKISLAMATPGKDEVNADFIKKLQEKMPHP